MAPAPHTDRRRGIPLVLLGVTVLSFDALLVRLAGAGGWEVAFWRGLLMAITLGATLLVLGRGRVPLPPPALRGPAAAAAVLFGLNTLLFVQSVVHTAVANTIVIFSATPLFAAVFTAVFLRERVPPRTWAAIATAMLALLGLFANSLSGTGLAGDLMALAAALVFAGGMTVMRRHAELSPVGVMAGSGLVTALLAVPFAQVAAVPVEGVWPLALMGLVQIPLSMALLAAGPHYLPAPEVGLLMLLEAVLGPLWVWMALGEQPPLPTVLAGSAIVATLIVHSVLSLRDPAGE